MLKTPGCPVTAPHHPDDRKEKHAVSVPALETSILACAPVKTEGVMICNTSDGVLMQERERQFRCEGS